MVSVYSGMEHLKSSAKLFLIVDRIRIGVSANIRGTAAEVLSSLIT